MTKVSPSSVGERRRLATRTTVKRTVLSLLRKGGYRELTYERIAARSGVAKSTLYRHWPSKAELVFDLVLHDRDLPSLAPTGSGDGDVAALADRMLAFVGGGVAARVFPGVLADVADDPALRQRFMESFVLGSQPELRPVLERIAADRGSALQRPVEDYQAILVGSVFAWLHVGGLSAAETRERLIRLVDDVVRGDG
ncbi:TetR/AcrR family transcriptional regulator [Nocardioides sp.]|uniref:TetR/AcrR family transcriptional regulator n=1 Tax=Nocardioides sp. TaxID=35761 RepID=UPI003526EDF7